MGKNEELHNSQHLLIYIEKVFKRVPYILNNEENKGQFGMVVSHEQFFKGWKWALRRTYVGDDKEANWG